MNIADKICIVFIILMLLFGIYMVLRRAVKPYDIEQDIVNGEYRTSVYYLWGNFNGELVWRVIDKDKSMIENRLNQAYEEIEKHKKLKNTKPNMIVKKRCN